MSQEAERAEARLIELEVRYTHQETLLRELSDVVYAQRQEIDALKQRLTTLEGRLGDVGDTERPTDPSEEIPPHY